MNQTSEKLVAAINARLKDRPLIFVAQEAERGLGLEGLLENFTIVATQEDYISIGLKARGHAQVFASPNTAKLPVEPAFLSYLKLSRGISKFGEITPAANYYVQFFKNTADNFISDLSQGGVNAQLLNNSAALTRSIENKVNQYQLLSDSRAAGYLPRSKISNLGNLNLQEQVDLYGGVVIQLPFGHTGSSTYMVYPTDNGVTENPELKELAANYPNRSCRVVEMIDGHPLTVNACVSGGKTYVAGLSYQYTGIAGLTTNPAATVGNDWTLPASLLDADQIAEIVKLTGVVGDLLQTKLGFKGLFGLDLVVDRSSGRIYLIEVNPRQTASVPMHTKLQLAAGQVPLALINLATFLNIESEIDADAYSSEAVGSLPGSQVFLRSHFKDKRALNSDATRSGIYRQQSDVSAQSEPDKTKIIYLDTEQDRPLIWQRDALSLADFDQEGILLLVKPSGLEVEYNEEVARIQAPFGLGVVAGIGAATAVKLKPLARDTLRQVSSEVLQ